MPRILVADDNAYMRNSMSRLLKKRGHIVDTACNGREAAMKIIRKEKAMQYYDILITDLMMPDIDGFKLVEMVRKNARPMGIIAISGGGGSIDGEEAINLVKPYIDEGLKKPFNHQDFVLAVEQAVKRHWARLHSGM